MRFLRFVAWIAILVAAPMAMAQGVKDDRSLFMPGSQQGDATALEAPDKCENCHAGYNAAVEPGRNWRGSMMAQAARDPLWLATMAVALQDSKHALGNFNAGDLCIRCHSPAGWLGGRSEPTNTTGLTGTDFEGVTCDFCHKLVDPIASLKQRDLPAETVPLAISETAKTYPADLISLAQRLLFDGRPFFDVPGELPVHYGTGALPDYIEATGGQFFVDTTTPKRGPRYDANPNHQFFYSRYHKSRYFCATCHDVSNPVVGSLVGGAGTPERQAAASYGHVERTFSEFMLSAFGRGSGAQTADKIGVGVASKCQDCHMRDVAGPACNKNGIAVRSDLALHDQTGGNVWMSQLLASADSSGPVYDAYNYAILSGTKYAGATVDVAGLQAQGQALASGASRALVQLQKAADLVVVQDSTESIRLRVVNNTGHKLISGYPEGRRIWLNVVFEGESGPIGEINGYQPLVKTTNGSGTDVYVSGAILTSVDDTLVWEANMASTLTGEAKTFHFVLATGRYKDNRIPPKGFDIASAGARLAVPVWHGVDTPALFTSAEYEGGYDEVTVAKPQGTTKVTAKLYYQTTSKEYMAFLRGEINGTVTTLPSSAYIAQTDPFLANLKGWGEAMWDLWVHNGGSAPIELASAVAETDCSANETPTLGTYTDTTMPAGSSTTVTPSSAPSDDGSVTVTATASAGFFGTVTANSTTGVVTIGNPKVGTYTITVTAIDTCGSSVTRTFQLTVTPVLSVSVNDVAVTEGDSGTVNAQFTVSLSEASASAVTVDWATADGTAAAPADYTAVGTTTLAFAAGETSKPVTVVVQGDAIDELDETFGVNLTNASNASIADAQGIGTILDDDPSEPPPAPTSVVATAATATSVGVSWALVGGAASYEIYRRSSGTSYAMVGTSVTTAYTDSTALANTAYFYALKAVDGSNNASTLSNPDLATTVIFTDATLTAGVTKLKAAHVTELRTAVNAVRALAGLGAAGWTDPVITVGTTKAKAAHFTELRTALDAARTALGFSASSWTDPVLTVGATGIKAAHITELRNGAK